MTLSRGQRIGPYEILFPIGAGGMGEVYKARDVRLDRTLAIKILPEVFASDPDRLRRFEQEARAASALNHPSILSVYDFGSSNGITFIATEYVEGKTLRELLAHGALPIKKLLNIAVGLAEGLASAHKAGIVHRDLKPTNLIVSDRGLVKILDFGLARLPDPGPRFDATAGDSLTDSLPNTTWGRLMGTVGYMSPEQANGYRVDHRSDQFAFGAIVYEMAAGRRAFRGETDIDILSAILHDDPGPISSLNPRAPDALSWILERCLEKDPNDRYVSTFDLASDLRRVESHLEELSNPRFDRRSAVLRSPLLLGAVILAGIVIGAAGWPVLSKQSHPTEPSFGQLTFRNGFVSRALFVPNSQSILYTASWDGQASRTFSTLPETPAFDRALQADEQLPFGFNSDASQVLVLLGQSRVALGLRGTLAWWPILGGSPRKILENVSWADWARQRSLLAAVRDNGQQRQLDVFDAQGRFLRTLFRTTGSITSVRFSPGEDQIAFFQHSSLVDPAGEVWLVSVEKPNATRLTPRFGECLGLAWRGKKNEIWFTASKTGTASRSLWAANTKGGHRLVYALPGDFVLQDVSPDEKCLLILRQDRRWLLLRRTGELPRDLSWFDRTFVSDIAADQRTLLFYDRGPKESSAVWMRGVDGGDAVRLAEGAMGRFSPSGNAVIALTVATNGPAQLVLVPTGAGAARQLTAPPAAYWAPTFAGSGNLLCVRTDGEDQGVWTLRTDGGGARLLSRNCDLPAANTDGRQFACVGDQGHSLYVQGITERERHKVFSIASDVIRFVRWDATSESLHLVTRLRRLLSIKVKNGAIVSDEELPLLANDPHAVVYSAAVSADATLQAYSVSRFSSSLYLFAASN